MGIAESGVNLGRDSDVEIMGVTTWIRMCMMIVGVTLRAWRESMNGVVAGCMKNEAGR